MVIPPLLQSSHTRAQPDCRKAQGWGSKYSGCPGLGSCRPALCSLPLPSLHTESSVYYSSRYKWSWNYSYLQCLLPLEKYLLHPAQHRARASDCSTLIAAGSFPRCLWNMSGHWDDAVQVLLWHFEYVSSPGHRCCLTGMSNRQLMF